MTIQGNIVIIFLSISILITLLVISIQCNSLIFANEEFDEGIFKKMLIMFERETVMLKESLQIEKKAVKLCNIQTYTKYKTIKFFNKQVFEDYDNLINPSYPRAIWKKINIIKMRFIHACNQVCFEKDCMQEVYSKILCAEKNLKFSKKVNSKLITMRILKIEKIVSNDVSNAESIAHLKLIFKINVNGNNKRQIKINIFQQEYYLQKYLFTCRICNINMGSKQKNIKCTHLESEKQLKKDFTINQKQIQQQIMAAILLIAFLKQLQDLIMLNVLYKEISTIKNDIDKLKNLLNIKS